MQPVLVFLVCLIASTVGGICGIGGGVVIKPVLEAADIMSIASLSFLSGLTVLLMAVVNLWKNRHERDLDVVRSLPLGIGAALGGVVGKQFFQMLRMLMGNDSFVALLQSVILGLLVLGTLLYVRMKSRIRSRSIRNNAAACGIGAALGVLSSFLGIGGGPMNLAVLYFFFSMTTKEAAINSLLIILLSQTASLLMTLVTASVPPFQWPMLGAMAAAGILGGLLSAKIHRKLSAHATDRLFSGLLIVILIVCAYNAVQAILR